MLFNNIVQVIDFESDIVDSILKRMGDEDGTETIINYTCSPLPFPCHVKTIIEVEYGEIQVRHEYRKIWIDDRPPEESEDVEDAI